MDNTNRIAGVSEKVKIQKGDHVMEVFRVDANEIIEHNGYHLVDDNKKPADKGVEPTGKKGEKRVKDNVTKDKPVVNFDDGILNKNHIIEEGE